MDNAQHRSGTNTGQRRLAQRQRDKSLLYPLLHRGRDRAPPRWGARKLK